MVESNILKNGVPAADPARFQLNSPLVADEEIDGEIIVINLASGNYYSLVEEAAEIWQMLRGGMSLGETADALGSRYQETPENLRCGVVQFVNELEREGLIVAAPAASPPPPANSSHDIPAAERPAFNSPKLNVYIDMQKMMLLDPIHEVDEAGWPAVKVEG